MRWSRGEFREGEVLQLTDTAGGVFHFPVATDIDEKVIFSAPDIVDKNGSQLRIDKLVETFFAPLWSLPEQLAAARALGLDPALVEARAAYLGGVAHGVLAGQFEDPWSYARDSIQYQARALSNVRPIFDQFLARGCGDAAPGDVGGAVHVVPRCNVLHDRAHEDGLYLSTLYWARPILV